MVKRRSVSASAAKAPIDGDGKAIANKILLSLSRKEFEQSALKAGTGAAETSPGDSRGERNYQIWLLRQRRSGFSSGGSA